MRKPIVVVDLFCGVGGFTQGAIDAGAEVILSVDAWDEACEVHRANHPDTRIDCIELGNPLWYKWLLSFLEPYRGTHQIHLHGSPPCQALSNASSRNPEEGMPLVIWFLNLVKSVQPDSWSMENVVPVRKRLPEGTPSVVLNSAYYGVPQTRSRCYAGSGWVAQPTHSKEEWVSVIQALPHLQDELYPDGSRLVLPIQRKIGKMKNGRILQPIWREIDQPVHTITTSSISIGTQDDSEPKKELGTTWAKPVVNTTGGGSSDGRRVCSADKEITKPSLTIHNNQPSLRDVSGKPVKIRSLTLEETLVLQGFDPEYNLSSAPTMKSRWTMVGNAVPPPVAEAVIRGIR